MHRVRDSLFIAFGVFIPVSAFSYVPTPGELRYLWEKERKISRPILLEYQLEGMPGMQLRFYVDPGGAWSKEIYRDGERREWIVKQRAKIWIYQKERWIEQPRRGLHWDDWLFELDFSSIESLLPPGFFFTRGVGEYERKKWIWIYGAHHHLAPPMWVGFLSRPLRPAMVREEEVFVRCVYGNALPFPSLLEIQRGEERWRFILKSHAFSPARERVPLPSFLLPER